MSSSPSKRENSKNSCDEKEFSDLIYLGLGYDTLIQNMHRMVSHQTIPLALLLRGPRGVGKKKLCTLISMEILGLYPWLSTVAAPGAFVSFFPHGPGPNIQENSWLGSSTLSPKVESQEKLFSSPRLSLESFPSLPLEGDNCGDIPYNFFQETVCSVDGEHELRRKRASVETINAFGKEEDIPRDSFSRDTDPQEARSSGKESARNLSQNLELTHRGVLCHGHHTSKGLPEATLIPWEKASEHAGHKKEPQAKDNLPYASEREGGYATPLHGAKEKSARIAYPWEGDFSIKNSHENAQKLEYSTSVTLPPLTKQCLVHWEQDKQRLLAHPEYLSLPEGASIEEIRSLGKKLMHTGTGSWRIVFLPEAQSLSTVCTNALLKWIESPPKHTIFLITASQALPKTLASRCVSYTMPPLGEKSFFSLEKIAQGIRGEMEETRDSVFLRRRDSFHFLKEPRALKDEKSPGGPFFPRILPAKTGEPQSFLGGSPEMESMQGNLLEKSEKEEKSEQASKKNSIKHPIELSTGLPSHPNTPGDFGKKTPGGAHPSPEVRPEGPSHSSKSFPFPPTDFSVIPGESSVIFLENGENSPTGLPKDGASFSPFNHDNPPRTLGEASGPSKKNPQESLWFKMSQGCWERGRYWKHHLPWVQSSWELFYHCAQGQSIPPENWMDTALELEEHLWEMFYIWSRDMQEWAYEQDFLWHWENFWESTWALVCDHRAYHTDLKILLPTLCARIHGFFMHYRLPPMPLPWESKY